MRRLLPLLLLLLASPAWGQAVGANPPQASSSGQTEPAVQLVRLSVEPAGEPVPALKYTLTVPLAEQTPGNAAKLLLQEVKPWSQMTQQDFEDFEKAGSWIKLSGEQLPLSRIRAFVARHGGVLEQADKAARQAECDWPGPFRLQDFSELEFGHVGMLAKILAVKVRLDARQGDFAQALHDLQTGYALGQDWARQKMLLTALLGVRVDFLMNQAAAGAIQAPGCPNLYWALTALPRPVVNLGAAAKGEKAFLKVPALSQIEGRIMTAANARQALRKILDRLPGKGDQLFPWKSDAAASRFVRQVLPRAKQYLQAHGQSPQQIKAMPAEQAVLIYVAEQYTGYRDKLYKLFYLPFWQAKPRLIRVERQIDALVATGEPEMEILPGGAEYYATEAQTDREIAFLRTVEALRMYASAHAGQLPADLGDLKGAPVPIDPVTGKAVAYHLVAGLGVLESPSPWKGLPALRYEIMIRPTSGQRSQP